MFIVANILILLKHVFRFFRLLRFFHFYATLADKPYMGGKNMKVLSLQTQYETQKTSTAADKIKRLQEAMNKNPKLADLFLKVSDSIEDQELVLIDTHPEEDSILKVEEVEKLLGLSRPTCNALFDDKKILGFKTEKGHRRFSKESVLSYLKKLHTASSAKDRFYKETGAKDWEL